MQTYMLLYNVIEIRLFNLFHFRPKKRRCCITLKVPKHGSVGQNFFFFKLVF